MIVTAKIEKLENGKLVLKPDVDISRFLAQKRPRRVEVRLDDGRTISADQRRKIFAIIRDISLWSGQEPEELRLYLEWDFCSRCLREWFSLSDCDMTTAREFITYLIQFCFHWGVSTKDSLLTQTDDIGKYLYLCLENRRCAICNRPAEVHHVDRVGMGWDREAIVHVGLNAIALCRQHHEEAHRREKALFADYHMARNLEVFPAWQNPVFAYDKDAIRNAVKLKNDSDIYISTGYSAYDCICFIKALLKKYDLDLEEDFVYSARPNSTALAGINWKNIAQEWCEERDKRGEIVFDIKNCEGRYVRFTTPFLNSVIPTNEDILSPWKTNNYYFYEITSDKNELYVQLYFYCKGIIDEMRTAFQKLANLTDGGKLTQGYRLFFKSSVFTQAENSTKSEIKNHLYRCLEEVRAFEMTIQDKWDS